MRIGFLLNHYAVHQVPHAVPYAFELSRRNPDFEVVIGCSSEREREVVESIATLYPGHTCELVMLRPPRLYDLVDPIVSKWSFVRKEMILRNNLDFFRSLDAIVAPERNCMKLRTRYGLELKMIHTRHGAGDREGGFDDRSGRVRFHPAAGPEVRRSAHRARPPAIPSTYRGDRRLAQVRGGAVDPGAGVISDLLRQRQSRRWSTTPTSISACRLGRPWGVQVLEFFANNPQLQPDLRAPRGAVPSAVRRHNAAYCPSQLPRVCPTS